jgi:uncharacterized protein (DUF305 family)
MPKYTSAFAAIAVACSLSGHAFAQDMAMGLPAACQTDAGKMASSMAQSSPMDHTTDMDGGHAALMAGMDTMNKNMMAGVMAPEMDVAFVCGMIPHHQAAIDMAKAELQYGKDAWTKQMAQKVIDAQTQEIADMTKWLEQHAKSDFRGALNGAPLVLPIRPAMRPYGGPHHGRLKVLLRIAGQAHPIS